MYNGESHREKGLQSMSMHANNARLAVGKEVTVNNRKVALLKYRGIVYAVDSKCPHMGKSLLIDIIYDVNTLVMAHANINHADSASSTYTGCQWSNVLFLRFFTYF
jgi:hypothetical protein